MPGSAASTRSLTSCSALHSCWKSCRAAGASVSKTVASGQRDRAAASGMSGSTPVAAGVASTTRRVPELWSMIRTGHPRRWGWRRSATVAGMWGIWRQATRTTSLSWSRATVLWTIENMCSIRQRAK